MKSDLIKKCEEIVARSRRVAERYQSLYNQHEKLKISCDDLRRQLNESQERMVKLNNEFQAVKMASAVNAKTEDNEQLKKKLNEYIREIDRCITYLKSF